MSAWHTRRVRDHQLAAAFDDAEAAGWGLAFVTEDGSGWYTLFFRELEHVDVVGHAALPGEPPRPALPGPRARRRGQRP